MTQLSRPKSLDMDMDYLYAVPISSEPVKFLDNATNSQNLTIMKEIASAQQRYLGKYENGGREDLHNMVNIALLNMYSMIENTNLKNTIIAEHNATFKESSEELKQHCESKLSFENPGKKRIDGSMEYDVKTSQSEDIVTKNFKNVENLPYDEKIQQLAYWSNRLAHACTDDIKTFYDRFYFEPTLDKAEKLKSQKEFKRNIENAYADFLEKEEYHFSPGKLLKDLYDKDHPLDLNSSKDPRLMKCKALMAAHGIPALNRTMIKDFIYCTKVQAMCEHLYDIKDNSIEHLIRHETDKEIPDEEKTLKLYRVRDNDTKSRKGSTSRIVVVNREKSNKLLKFNDRVFFTDRYIVTLANKLKKPFRIVRDTLHEKYKNKLLDRDTSLALEQECRTSIFHANDIALDEISERYGCEIDDICPPMIESMAFFGGGIYDTNPSPEKQGFFKSFLQNIEKKVEENKLVSRQKGGYLKFCNKMKIDIENEVKGQR